MGKYGQTAVIAARHIEEGCQPRMAWEMASCEVFRRGSASQKKGCPKNAFLGLYGGGGKNAAYAQAALAYLTAHRDADITADELWRVVMGGALKQHNGQMDVVLSLYRAGLIE